MNRPLPFFNHSLTLVSFCFIIFFSPVHRNIIELIRECFSTVHGMDKMFYKPNFCCHCGEKIDIIDWKLLTSRRFCQLCASEQQQHDLIPRVIVGFGLIAGLFGFGAYLQSGNAGKTDLQNLSLGVGSQKRSLTSDVDGKGISANSNVIANSKPLAAGQNPETGDQSQEQPSVNSQSLRQTGIKKITSDEQVYFCGAITKKGTPCSRRIKPGSGRCWQHAGRSTAADTQKTSAGF